MQSDLDPIVAIATAQGRGGIGVIRISGKNIESLSQRLLQKPLVPRHAHYLPFLDEDGSAIDTGIALYFPAPHSYTGESVLELQGHGGPMVLKRLLNRCLQVGKNVGLRLAEPGEFTRRAFLNDRIDLAQAEAIADLIDASSEAAARSAAASLSGVFSQAITALADRVIHLRMLVEATLDFPEEEIDFLEKYQAKATLTHIQNDLNQIIKQANQGAILRQGLHIVLAGQPNVGKSSLLNALAGNEVAIVTPIAGTTRDKVIQEIHLDGVPLHIIDTAGLRETDDIVEQIGIERSWSEIARADAILFLQDATQQNSPQDVDILARLPEKTPQITVINKIDLVDQLSPSSLTDKIYLSAKTGAGIDSLKQALLDIAGWNPSAESPYLARERHLQALHLAQTHLEIAQEHAQLNDQVLDLFAEELRLAHNALCSITGVFTSDDLLGVIFSSFCIGK